MEESTGTAPRKTVYLSLHENFVRENIAYTDRATGEERTFNQVRLPAGTIVDGVDVGGYEFSPLFVNPSKYRGEHWRDIPLIADRELWLRKSVLDEEGNPVVGADGRPERDLVKVMPEQVKDALIAARRAYVERMREADGLGDRAEAARAAAGAARTAPPARGAQAR